MTSKFMYMTRTHRSTRVFMDVWRACHRLYWRILGGRKHRYGRPRPSWLSDKQHIMHWYNLLVDAETIIYIAEI